MSILDHFFKRRVIVNCDHDAYLYRWYVFRTPWVALFIHKFVRSDEDRALHDHPWPFLVIPIWRGYIEHSDRKIGYPPGFAVMCRQSGVAEPPDREKVTNWVWPIFGTRLRSALYRHRVQLHTNQDGQELPAWSLFFRFKGERVWGFWPKEGFVAWNKWWAKNCE